VSERPKVWVTRAEPGAAATAARLTALGFEPLVAPLLAVRELKTELDLCGVAALAFTSSNAVRLFATREARRNLPVFTVGDATAEAAKQAGFHDVQSAAGDVRALCRLIGAVQPGGLVMAPGGVERAGDLVGGLKRVGVAARTVALYDTPAVETLPTEAAQALAARAIDAVLIHSPRAAAILADLAEPFDLSKVTAGGLSFACLRPVRRLRFAAFVQATHPRDDALLDALFAALGNSAPPR
jgi:uroporphyrinogen-III synthase